MRLNEGRPSATAYRVAVRRAAHQILDSPRVLEDPVAVAILGGQEVVMRASDDAVLIGPRARASRFMRAFVVARSRIAEDQLAKAVAAGVKQYVVLGAGLDTFAYRNPFPQLRVFEVDHPATQEWKRFRLRQAQIEIPASVQFTPVDFSRETFVDGLCRVGFCTNEPAFFSWLGVTMYLNRDAVLATFRAIIGMCPENGVAFDYCVPRASLSFLNRVVFDALARRVAAAGEPFIGFFDTPELADSLRQMGYGEIESLAAHGINARYFAERTDRLRVGGALAHVMVAQGRPVL